MSFEIVGDVDKNRFYCAGSFTKLLTTFASLSRLAEDYDLASILDDDQFLDTVCTHPAAREFLDIMHKHIGSQFTLRDVCTFYDGLPYTFDISDVELEKADKGRPFKHHSIMHEDTFLLMCRTCITPVDPNRCKFHYSELSIILLGYLIEQIYQVKMESLYQKYIIDAFSLQKSCFSRTKPENVYFQDLSERYDYPCVAFMDHGFFCYGNGFFTTLNEQKQLLDHLVTTPVFKTMIDTTHARAALNQILNGLTIEIRLKDDDLIVGYDGMSYSGCNAFAYSVKKNKGFVTIANDPEPAYQLIHQHIGYQDYDEVPEHTLKIYREFLANQHYEFETKAIPDEYLGQYQRVMINDKNLATLFTVAEHYIDIRNPEPIRYNVLYDHGIYRIDCQDHMHGAKVGFYQAKSGNRYMLFDGTLYKKLIS